jgi:hypothetical protein
MPVTAEQIFTKCMDIIDARLPSGIISPAETAEYRVKTPSILTMGQNELMSVGGLYKTHEISCKPIPNLLGLLSNFDIQEGTDLTFNAIGSVKAYYFEVDGDCTVTIEDYDGQWNTLATINVTGVTSFTGFKGVVTATPNATQSRMRFTGTYYFKTVNRALYGLPVSPSKVPDYRPWVKYTMPEDFSMLDMIINEFPVRQYARDANYKWEGKKDLYINYYYEGNIRIVYKPVPTPITDLSQTLEIDDITATTILPYYLGAHLMLEENSDLASYFNGRFMELKAMATLPKPVSEQAIINVYGNY